MKKLPNRQTAFSLVEVTLALGVMAVCLVPLLGLLPIGVNSDQAAVQQTGAAGLAAALVADLRSAPTPLPGATPQATPSPRFLITVPAAAPSPAPSPAVSTTVLHTLFLTADGAVADANASNSPPTTAQDDNAQPALNPYYRATLIFTPPSVYGYRSATSVRVLVTWPAMADPTGGVLPTNFAGSFETMVSLDRN